MLSPIVFQFLDERMLNHQLCVIGRGMSVTFFNEIVDFLPFQESNFKRTADENVSGERHFGNS